MLRRMFPKLQLTVFFESFHGEQQGLVLQIQCKDVGFRRVERSGPDMVPVVEDVSLHSSLQRIPYDSLSRLPPSELDISRSFSAAEFSTPCSLYLAPKIASFVSDMASSFGEISPPSLFIFAELKTINWDSCFALPHPFAPMGPLIPRRQDPFRQPRGSPLGSRMFYDDYLISDTMEVPETEDKEAGDCSVCLEEMSAIEELLTTPCDHIFHEQCILSWLEKKNSCPLCRSQLQD